MPLNARVYKWTTVKDLLGPKTCPMHMVASGRLSISIDGSAKESNFGVIELNLGSQFQ